MEPPYTPTHEIAYCVGLIVGEGSFTGSRDAPWLSLKLHVSDPQPLLHLRSVFGGVIYGPYSNSTTTVLAWILRGWELEEALRYFDRWLPPSRKRDQYEAWKVKWAAFFERQRRIRPRMTKRFRENKSFALPNVKQ